MPLIRSIHAAIALLLLAFAVGFYTDHPILRADESTVFDLMQQDHWTEVHEQWQFSHYATILKRYEINSKAAGDTLGIQLTQATQAQQQGRKRVVLWPLNPAWSDGLNQEI